MIAQIERFYLKKLDAFTDIERELILQQQTILCGNVRAVILVNMINGGLLMAAFWNVVDFQQSFIWYLSIVLLPTIQLIMWWPYRGGRLAKAVTVNTLKLMRWTAVLGIIRALLWSSILFVFHTPDQLHYQVFLCAIIAGMAAGTVSIYNTIPEFNLAHLLVTVLMAGSILLYSGTLLFYSIAGLLFVLCVALMSGSLQGYKGLCALVEASHERANAKADLIDAIESTNDAFAIFNSNGDLIQANARFKTWLPSEDLIQAALVNEQMRLPNGKWIIGSVRATSKGGLVCVHTDVSGLKEREAELITAKKEAEAADSAKSRFLAMMSHELRTPLNVILGLARLMGSKSNIKLADFERQEYCDNIIESSSHLLNLMNDMIDFSQIGSDNYIVNARPVPAKEIINWAVTYSSKNKQGYLDCDIETSISTAIECINVDEISIRRVLVNLINNAVKFSHAGAKIFIRAGIDRLERPFISIKDKGIGIPKDQLRKVFEAFYQVNGNMNRSHDGAGLGLTLSQELMRLHGGEVTVSSKVSKGTTVTLSFPPEKHIHYADLNLESDAWHSAVNYE